MSTLDDEKRNDKSRDEGQAQSSAGESILGRCYEICIGGKLDASWSEWFEGLEMHPWGEDCTMLWGRVADQAALLGILNKLCRLNLTLVSVNERDEKAAPPQPGPKGGA